MAKKQLGEGVRELLYQALETELGGAKVYEAALSVVTDEALREEWQKYRDETLHHQEVLRSVFDALGLDPDEKTRGRAAVAGLGKALVAQIVAAECVVLAETKDHLNWELIGLAAGELSGDAARVLKDAHDEVEPDEDHHLYHTRGWTRELWMDSMDFKAALPPPEEVRKVDTAIGAARAEHARGRMAR